VKRPAFLLVSLFSLCITAACGGGSGNSGGGGAPGGGEGAGGGGANSTGQFTLTGSMMFAPQGHAATLLSNGDVLVTGGENSSGALATAEIFDTTSGAFALTGSMGTARSGHTATLLGSGKVLVVGGADTNGNAIASAEIFDLASGTFSFAGSMEEPREGHTATLLNDGRVLVAGGGSATAELFDPNSGTFTPAGKMSASRSYHGAVLLGNGEVLVAGGTDSSGTALGELFDPVTATFTPTSTGLTQALHLAAAALDNGGALFAGGQLTTVLSGGSTRCCVNGPVSTALALVFSGNASDPPTPGNLIASRSGPTATTLGSGQVLTAGGSKISSQVQGTSAMTTIQPLASAELYDPSSGTSALAGNMSTARAGHTATLLGNGKVLLVGGVDANGNTLSTAEFFQ
jgi:Galactose oxidase, central domain